jgi:LysM repeat protein
VTWGGDLSVAATRAVIGVSSDIASPASLPVGESSSVRLTARGRLCVAIAILLVSAALLLVAHQSWTSPKGAVPAVPSAVVVQPGDTLWSIARAVAPHQDPRVVVDRLVERNGIRASALVPGQVLRIS